MTERDALVEQEAAASRGLRQVESWMPAAIYVFVSGTLALAFLRNARLAELIAGPCIVFGCSIFVLILRRERALRDARARLAAFDAPSLPAARLHRES